MRVKKPRILLEAGGEDLPSVAQVEPFGVIAPFEGSESRRLIPWHKIDVIYFDRRNVEGPTPEPQQPTPESLIQTTFEPQEPARFLETRYRNLVPGDKLALPVSKEGQPTGAIRERGEILAAKEVVFEDARKLEVETQRPDGETTVVYVDPTQQCYVLNPQWLSWVETGVARTPQGQTITRDGGS